MSDEGLTTGALLLRQPRGLGGVLAIVRAIAGYRDRRELYPAIAAAVRRVISCDVVGISIAREADAEMLDSWSDPAVELPTLRKVSYLQSYVDPGASRIFREDLRDHPVHLAMFDRIGIEASLRMPLVVEDRVIGALVSWTRDRRAHDDVDLRVATEIGRIVGIAVDRCLAYEELQELRDAADDDNAQLRAALARARGGDELIGRSAPIQRVREQIQLVAPTDATVLITGESGTGKELVARAIHAASCRAERPMVTVNCAALPAHLAESELFGHEEGAFTGATRSRIGRFEAAHLSTVFLDEVGELSLDVQAKLLRVLQERELERLGGGAPVAVDLRVIAATNRDLPAMVAAGTFREDLFYRLSVFPVQLPPLRARKDDLALLVDHFVERAAARFRLPRRRVTPEGMRRVVGYDWPGNVRELGNAVERATIVSAGEALDLESVVPGRLIATGPAQADELRREYLAALEACGWVIEGAAGAAARVGLHPNTFRHRIKKLGISRPGR